jgi:hypothetical protein
MSQTRSPPPVRVVVVAGDVRKRSTADELVETPRPGPVGIVVNNGITRDRMLSTCPTRTGTP